MNKSACIHNIKENFDYCQGFRTFYLILLVIFNNLAYFTQFLHILSTLLSDKFRRLFRRDRIDYQAGA